MKVIQTPFGASALWARGNAAISPFVLNQMQQIANELNRPMRLIVVEEIGAQTLTPIRPGDMTKKRRRLGDEDPGSTTPPSVPV